MSREMNVCQIIAVFAFVLAVSSAMPAEPDPPKESKDTPPPNAGGAGAAAPNANPGTRSETGSGRVSGTRRNENEMIGTDIIPAPPTGTPNANGNDQGWPSMTSDKEFTGNNQPPPSDIMVCSYDEAGKRFIFRYADVDDETLASIPPMDDPGFNPPEQPEEPGQKPQEGEKKEEKDNANSSVTNQGKETEQKKSEDSKAEK